MTNLNIGFATSSDFTLVIAQNILENYGQNLKEVALVQAKKMNLDLPILATLPDFKIVLKIIITQPVKTRKTIVGGANAITNFANKYNLELFQPSKINFEADIFLNFDLDICIVASFGQIISTQILDIPKHGFVNWHPSKLPKYRGASPIQSVILNQETESALTWIQMIKEMDAGNIILQIPYKLNQLETFDTLAKQNAELGKDTWAIVLAFQILEKLRT
jgi:methionyl-tRNA formyltransferase